MKKVFLLLVLISTNVFSQVILSKNWLLYNSTNSPLTSNKILSIISDVHNNYWIATGPEFLSGNVIANGYLHRLNNNNWEIFNETNSPLTKNIVEDVAISKTGKILVATTKGLYIKDSNGWDSLNTSNSLLPDNFIYRVTVDKINRYWLGIPNYGIAVYANGNWTLYNDDNTFYGIGDFNFIEVDSLNNIWIGTDLFGLYCFDGNNWAQQITGYPKSIVGCSIDKNNTKWVAIHLPGGGKIGKLSDTAWVYYDSTNISFNIFRLSYNAVIIDKNGIKYFGTTKGLVIYNDTIWTKIDTSNSPIPAQCFNNGSLDFNNNKIFGIGNCPAYYYGLIFYNQDSVIVTSVVNNAQSTSDFHLYQNYPNPFNPETKIKFSIPKSELVQIKVYDILGKEIRTLLNEYKQVGTYEVEFDASNLLSGVYFYRMISGSFSETKKILLLR